MNILQVLALVAFSVTIVSSQECDSNAVNPISSDEGMIDGDSLWKGPYCNHTWIFINLPNKDKMLLINITKAPLRADIIKLYDENFIDSEDPEYKCLILNTKPTDASELNDMMSQVVTLHRMYPGCRVQYGLSPPVRLSYVPWPSSPLLVQNFEIKYRAVGINEVSAPTEDVNIVKSTTTLSTHSTESTSTTSTPVSPTGKHSKDEQMTIILVVLAGIAVLLLAFLVTALLIRRNRLKQSANKHSLPLDDQYQTVPEISPGSTVATSEVLYNEIYPNNREPNSRQDVLNPLYDSGANGGKHAYEYIEIKLTPQREERSQL